MNCRSGTAPYRVRVKSLFDRKHGGASGVFYPVIALLDDTYIVVHMTGLESLRLEPALATPGGESGLAVSIGIDPAEQKGKYLVVFTPAALLGKPPPGDREGDMLSISSLAWMERRGESALPPSPYGRLKITVAPDIAMAGPAKQRIKGRPSMNATMARNTSGAERMSRCPLPFVVITLTEGQEFASAWASVYGITASSRS